jgi:NAD-dependent dihydropyrimidine dehydrogenase PreA subunit
MAQFIAVDIDAQVAADAALSAKLVEVCPVNIFAQAAGGLETVDANLDECVLCELCLNICAPGAIKIRKLYGAETVLQRS